MKHVHIIFTNLTWVLYNFLVNDEINKDLNVINAIRSSMGYSLLFLIL